MLRGVKAFFAFWYDFLVGDDIVVAIGAVVAVGATVVLVDQGVNAWWLMPIAAALLLWSRCGARCALLESAEIRAVDDFHRHVDEALRMAFKVPSRNSMVVSATRLKRGSPGSTYGPTWPESQSVIDQCGSWRYVRS